MKALRLYWLVKGKQDYKIGDNIKDEISDFDDYWDLDWHTDFEKLVKDVNNAFQIRNKIHQEKGQMINSNLYITTSTGVIRGIIPINKEKGEAK